MSDPKYNRLLHAGDFESKQGVEVFYLAPKPLPTGATAFSGLRMHRERNEVFLDFALGKAGLEFAVRIAVGSNMGLVIFFFLVSGVAAWARRDKEGFFGGWVDFFATWPIWALIGCLILINAYYLYQSIRQIISHPPSALTANAAKSPTCAKRANAL